jgi:TrwC relaxase
VLTIRAMSSGAGYVQRHLEHSDYYDEHRRVIGEWHGRGAELLGLHGEVETDRTNHDGSDQSKALICSLEDAPNVAAALFLPDTAPGSSDRATVTLVSSIWALSAGSVSRICIYGGFPYRRGLQSSGRLRTLKCTHGRRYARS